MSQRRTAAAGDQEPPLWPSGLLKSLSDGAMAEVFRIAGELAAEAVGSPEEGRKRLRRNSWSRDGRMHLEVKGLGDPSLPADLRAGLADGLEEALGSHPGLAWAAINEAVGHVVLEHDAVPVAEILGIIEEVEASYGLSEASFPHLRPDHPGDDSAFRRQALLAGLDAAFFVIGAACRAGGVTPLAHEVVSLVSFLDDQPTFLALVSQAVGARQAEVLLGSVNAVAQGLAQGLPGLLVDLGYRLAAAHAARSRTVGFGRLEPSLFGGVEFGSCRIPSLRERGQRSQQGPVQRHARRSLAAGSAGGIGTALVASDFRRGVAMLHAGIPKASRLGQEMFLAQLGTILARREALVMDPASLGILDRVDTVLVDADALSLCSTEALDRLAAAARDAGHMLVVQGDKGGIERFSHWEPDLVFAAGSQLLDAMAMLQEDGCVVMAVSFDAALLEASDFGVGPLVEDKPAPWGASLLAPERELWWLAEAASTAAHLSRQSVAMASVGAAMGSVAALGTTEGSESGPRAALAVNLVSLLAMANAVRASAALASRQPPQLCEEPPPFHSMPVEAVLERLGSSEEGISDQEAALRMPKATPAARPAVVRLAAHVTEELANPLTPVLAAGSAMSASLGSTLDAGIVAFVGLANAMLGALQRLHAEGELERLEAEVEIPVSVIRSGRRRLVRPKEVVVGDVVELAGGDAVVADCRVIGSEGLGVDQSSITGESEPVYKWATPCEHDELGYASSMVYANTAVAFGTARAVVVAVGEDTRAAMADSAGEGTFRPGVEGRLARITSAALPVSLGGGMAAGLAALLHGQPLSAALGTGVTLAVAAVPEGLPVVATLAQLAAARRLAKVGALVRNPKAVEALGRVEVLCTDKTGTLTMGRAEVGMVSDGVADCVPGELTRRHRDIVAAALRATSQPAGEGNFIHPTDAAVEELGAKEKIGRGRNMAAWEAVGELPFDPSRAFHATLGAVGGRHYCSVKGAPEVLLQRCGRWRTTGRSRPVVLDGPNRAAAERKVEDLARRGMRVLAVAEGLVGGGDFSDASVEGLTLIGFLGLSDPLRQEAASALGGLADAGVRVVMVTGDHPSTAEGIGAQAGILDGGRMLAGSDLASMSDAELDAVVGEVSVFARVSPADKVRVVESLQRIGKAVAVTGDGANDAAAIRLADVGVAMGEHCAPAARQAADVVIADGDLETLIAAVLEGRALWRSVRAGLALLLGGNLGEVAFTVASSAVGGRRALSPRQLLVVNLMTDVVPALAVATRPPAPYVSADLLKEGPELSLGRQLERAIVLRAGITSAATAGAWFAARATGDASRASTVALVTLVGAQLGQTLVSGINHPPVVAACTASAALLAVSVQTPGLSRLIDCVPLPGYQWAIAAVASSAAALGAAVAPAMAGPALALVRELVPRPPWAEAGEGK